MIEVLVKHTGQADVAKAMSQLRDRARTEGLFFEMRRRRFHLNPTQDKKLKRQMEHKEKLRLRQNRLGLPTSGTQRPFRNM